MARSRLQNIIDGITANGILALFSLIAVFPVFYSLMTSFKNVEDVLTIPPTLFPPHWTLDGYRLVFQSELMRYYLPNTIINAVAATAFATFFAGLAAYAFSRYRFRGSGALQAFVLLLFMIPGLTNLVSYYRLGSELGLLSTNIAMIIIYTAVEIPFAIWLIKAFFDAIPIELEEAARVDGCTDLQSLWYVVIPLALPGLFTAALLMVIYLWNEFMIAISLLVQLPSRTATVGLYDFQTTMSVQYHALSAAAITIALPIIVVFLVGRRTFFRAMIEGALKG